MTTYTAGGGMPRTVAGPYEAASLTGQMTAQQSMPGASMPGVQQPMVQEALRQQTAALLQHVYRWLEATVPAAPQVLGVVPMLVTAVQLYEAEQYPASLNQVQAATSVLQQARWAYPALPPL